MNRVWMITGAGRGLGRAFAEEAVKNGDMVIATVRKVNSSDPLMKNIYLSFHVLIPFQTDDLNHSLQPSCNKSGNKKRDIESDR